MELTILGSSSSGNGYVLQSDEEALIIEAGIHPSKVKHALNFNTQKVKGCFISHAHGDHAKHAALFENIFPVYANRHVIETKKLKSTKEIQAGHGVICGRFKVLPFTAFHDIPTLGFLIHHPDMGTLVFLTDSFMTENIFKGVNHFLVECNYSDEALQSAIEAGHTHPAMRKRLMTTHMEIRTAERFILSHDLSEAYNIILIHLSIFNSDRKEFTDILTRSTGKSIVIAETDLKVTLNNSPY